MASRWPLVKGNIMTTEKGFDAQGRPFKKRLMAERTYYDRPYGKHRTAMIRKDQEAHRRQLEKLTPEQRLKRLNEMVGPEGGKKQRARYLKQIEEGKKKNVAKDRKA